jgi:DNA-directed RNA polymerase specialized sigma subunit
MGAMRKRKKSGLPRLSVTELRRLYHADKKSLATVGEEVGISRQAVHQRLERAGIERRKSTPRQPSAVKKLRSILFKMVFETERPEHPLSVILKEVNWEQHWTDETKIPWIDEEIRRLYVEEGLTLEKVGSIFSVSAVTIMNRLEKMGVARRSTGPVESNKKLFRK